MIRLNGEIVNVEHYPDGTQRLVLDVGDKNFIEWFYEGDAELISLMYLVGHCRETAKRCPLFLYMYYIPNARMDRVHDRFKEVFTLKHFCRMINSLEFDTVYVLDPHSNVSVGLLDRCVQLDVAEYIRGAIRNIAHGEGDMVLYFPDAGAFKKYAEMLPEYKCCHGMKNRDWETGRILGLDIVTSGLDISGKRVLMVDDIVAYGGTMRYGAEKLLALGVKEVFAYATHTENSVLDEEKGTLLKALQNGTVKKLFTTDSLYTGQSEYIDVMELHREDFR